MIIGIDLNSKSVAMCLIERPRLPILQMLTVKVGDRSRMLAQLHDYVAQHVYPEDIVFVESPVLAGARNIQSTIKVAAAYGAVLAACAQAHARCVEVPISLWKVHTVGKGNASKSDVSEWLYTQHPSVHRECAGQQDLIDASCIALYGERECQTGDRGHVLHQAQDAQDPRHRPGRDRPTTAAVHRS